MRSFSGLKALTSVNCESESSFMGKESIAALRDSFAPKAVKQNHDTVTVIKKKKKKNNIAYIDNKLSVVKRVLFPLINYFCDS